MAGTDDRHPRMEFTKDAALVASYSMTAQLLRFLFDSGAITVEHRRAIKDAATRLALKIAPGPLGAEASTAIEFAIGRTSDARDLAQ